MKISTIAATTALLATAFAGPVAYGACQAGCASIVMACYSAAGFTWGATAGATAPATIIACNAAFGKCSALSTDNTLRQRLNVSFVFIREPRKISTNAISVDRPLIVLRV
ncbi:hypothetical protein FSHL1_006334 [Fusarium sambucinum]